MPLGINDPRKRALEDAAAEEDEKRRNAANSEEKPSPAEPVVEVNTQTGSESRYIFPQKLVDEKVALLMTASGKIKGESEILAALRAINDGERVITNPRYTLQDLIRKYTKIFGFRPDFKW